MIVEKSFKLRHGPLFSLEIITVIGLSQDKRLSKG